MTEGCASFHISERICKDTMYSVTEHLELSLIWNSYNNTKAKQKQSRKILILIFFFIKNYFKLWIDLLITRNCKIVQISHRINMLKSLWHNELNDNFMLFFSR